MGCAPSKGNRIAVQPAMTPRPNSNAHPPVTPPLNAWSKSRPSDSNPLDERRPLPAIGAPSDSSTSHAGLTARKSNLSTVPEVEYDESVQPNIPPKIDVNAMVSDAKENNLEVKHTQSSVAFTFDFGETSIKPAGRLPPLIREKTMKRETDADELKNSILKKQQQADDRRQNELNSIASKKKRRKVRMKRKSTSEDNQDYPNQVSEALVPPLEISSSTDKNGGSPPNAHNSEINTSTPVRGQTIAVTAEVEPQPEPRKGSANNDSTYGSGDENESRNVDPLRRFSRKNKKVVSDQDDFYSEEENVNPMEAAKFFDDSSEQL